MNLYSYEAIKKQYLGPSSKNRTSKILANEYRPISELKKSFKQSASIINEIAWDHGDNIFVGLEIGDYGGYRLHSAYKGTFFWTCMILLGSIDPSEHARAICKLIKYKRPKEKFTKKQEIAYIGNPNYFISPYYLLKRLYESTYDKETVVKSELEKCINKATEYYNKYFRYTHLSELYKEYYKYESTSSSYLEFWTERLIDDETMLKKSGLFPKYQELFDKMIYEYNELNFENLIILYKLFAGEYYKDTEDEDFFSNASAFINLTRYFIYPELTEDIEESELQKNNILVKFIEEYCFDKEFEKVLVSHFTNLRWIYTLQNMEKTTYLLHKELLKTLDRAVKFKIRAEFKRDSVFMTWLFPDSCNFNKTLGSNSSAYFLENKLDFAKSMIEMVDARGKNDYNLNYFAETLDINNNFYHWEVSSNILLTIEYYRKYVAKNYTDENFKILCELIEAYDDFDYETIFAIFEKILPIILMNKESRYMIYDMHNCSSYNINNPEIYSIINRMYDTLVSM